MEDGYKNREVVSHRYESALNILTDAERNEYLRDGHITVQEQVDVWSRRDVEEKRYTRHETRKYGLEDILQAEFYACDFSSDGVPFTHFIHMEYGLVSVICFSDKTILIQCDEKYRLSYFRDIFQKYECEMLGDFIRLDITKKKDPYWKINLLKQLLQ